MTVSRHPAYRWVFGLVLTLYVAFCVLSLFCFPYQSKRLYGAIPENATFVSEHVYLTDRWQGLCTNPVIKGVLGGLGVRASDLEGFARDHGTAQLINRLMGRHLMTAYSPALPGSGHPGWVFTSWGGGNLQWVRWGVLSGLLDNFEKRRMESGQVVWSMQTDRRQPQQRLALTADEGQVFGCLGEDAEAVVQALVWRVQAEPAPIPELAGRLATDPDASRSMDRVWLRNMRVSETITMPEFTGDLEFSGATGLVARGVGWGNLPELKPVNESLDVAQLIAVLKDAPSLIMAAPLRLLEPTVRGLIADRRMDASGMASLYDALDPQGAISLALLGGEHSGRIASFKVPTLVLVTRLKPGVDVRSLVKQILDGLNAKYQLGLIARYYDVGSGRVVTAEATVEGAYSMIEENERPALFIKDGQVFVFSNCGVLKRLLGLATDLESYLPMATAPLLPGPEVCPVDLTGASVWAAGMRSTGLVVYAWADLRTASRAARDALAIYSLATYAGEFRSSRKSRRTLETIGRWIQTLGAFDQCELKVGIQQGKTEVLLSLQGR